MECIMRGYLTQKRKIKHMAKIEITNNTDIPLSNYLKELIKNIVKISLEKENINPCAIVDITVITNEEIKRLNKSYRNFNKITDVLSFPMVNFERGENIPEKGQYVLGDIVFSINMAYEQAKEYNHSIEREIGFFIAHSMLHLLGYDHESEDNENIMISKQHDILMAAGLPR